MSDGKVTVRFTRHFEIYNSGEAADFAAERAQQLVNQGVATLFDPTAEETKQEVPPPTPATLEELEAEVKAAGYADEAAKAIAQKRFDGVYGEEARFVGAVVEYDELTEEQVRSALGKKTKAELVVLAKSELNLDLAEDSKKDELIDAIVAAMSTEKK
jgi:hypothetical protein